MLIKKQITTLLPPFFLMFFIFTAGCSGGKASQNFSEGSPSTSTSNSLTFANPGPTSCLTSYSSNEIKYVATQKTPLPIDINSYLINDNHRENLQIYGGKTIANTVNCSSSTPGAKQIAQQSTVAIKIPVSSSSTVLCSGVLVSDGNGKYLILTAAHCFNRLPNYNDRSANGATVYFGEKTDTAQKRNVYCWQRHKFYHSIQADPSDSSVSLFDIAWVQFTGTLPSDVTPAAILSNPSIVTNTDEKVFAGFGLDNSGNNSSSSLHRAMECTSTSVDSTYAFRGDINPTGSIYTYNSNALNILGASIASTQAFEKYLTVIGPINGINNDQQIGTCFGDSGGPVFVNKSGVWQIYGITQGSDSLLSPKPTAYYFGSTNKYGYFNSSAAAGCADGYGVYTTLGNLKNWIFSTSHVAPL